MECTLVCPVNTHSPGQLFHNPRTKQRSLFATQMNLRQYYYDFDSVPRIPRSFWIEVHTPIWWKLFQPNEQYHLAKCRFETLEYVPTKRKMSLQLSGSVPTWDRPPSFIVFEKKPNRICVNIYFMKIVNNKQVYNNLAFSSLLHIQIVTLISLQFVYNICYNGNVNISSILS